MAEKVKMYTLSTCSHCKATKKFMDKSNVEYDFVDVDKIYGDERAAVLDEVKKWNRCRTATLEGYIAFTRSTWPSWFRSARATDAATCAPAAYVV